MLEINEYKVIGYYDELNEYKVIGYARNKRI